jgi:hypothetical protein
VENKKEGRIPSHFRQLAILWENDLKSAGGFNKIRAAIRDDKKNRDESLDIGT